MTDSAIDSDGEIDQTPDEISDAPWRERVLSRSLGAATRQTLDRAAELMKATVELLEVSGESVTVQDVADRAGFSLRVLYRHFSSKEDLLAAVLEDKLEGGAARQRELLAGIEDPVERIAEFLRGAVRIERTPLNVALAKQEILLLMSRPTEVARAQAPMATLAEELVADAVRAGRIDPTIADHVAYSMMALKRAYNHARLLDDHCGLTLPTEEQLVEDCLRTMGIDTRS